MCVGFLLIASGLGMRIASLPFLPESFTVGFVLSYVVVGCSCVYMCVCASVYRTSRGLHIVYTPTVRGPGDNVRTYTLVKRDKSSERFLA